ncbi:hypothetical protein SCE1572_44575 [Sorangium cellulosum So0157-2]|uniref:Uncharacterized protein n=1 Tax=Sorangium cellulosum So0157-2 TaxID=1254432 RepID=S4Y9G9_SORCE|nr:hypothetical protein SCE1572_44570 [Sorangium cellulosum So0157-2]AGP40957.1 hypothetical protein SCE1572_44575 [Sorangium cellulosum So0157-2]
MGQHRDDPKAAAACEALAMHALPRVAIERDVGEAERSGRV